MLDQGTMDKEAVEDLFDISSEQLACVNGAEPGTWDLSGLEIRLFLLIIQWKRTAVCISYLIPIFMRW